jgi:arylsulfatase A-like enzyme
LPQFLPTSNGFDSYFGIPYSNDMDRVAEQSLGRSVFQDPKVEYWNVPLMQNEKIVERPADQNTITRRYTEEAVRLIKQHAGGPFFLYLAHNLPHVPLFRSHEFAGRSARGLYGDVVEEVDWSVGQVLDALRQSKIAENTLVFFSSDNGPWLPYDQQGGSAGLLRDGKGSTWEGGMRVPTLAWWPGKVRAGSVTQDLGSTMDIYTTAIELAGGAIPKDRVVDGGDLRAALFGLWPTTPRHTLFYYRGAELFAVRSGPWKAHFITQDANRRDAARQTHDPPLLFHLEQDPSEKYDVSKEYPLVLAILENVVKQHQANLQAPPSQLEIPIAK